MKLIYIEPYGKAISDWDLDTVLDDIVHASAGSVFRFCNFSIIRTLRLYLLQNPERQGEYKFFVDGMPLIYNQYMANNGFNHPVWDRSTIESEQILRLAITKRQEVKNGTK